jgi:hypothetical protein
MQHYGILKALKTLISGTSGTREVLYTLYKEAKKNCFLFPDTEIGKFVRQFRK